MPCKLHSSRGFSVAVLTVYIFFSLFSLHSDINYQQNGDLELTKKNSASLVTCSTLKLKFIQCVHPPVFFILLLVSFSLSLFLFSNNFCLWAKLWKNTPRVEAQEHDLLPWNAFFCSSYFLIDKISQVLVWIKYTKKKNHHIREKKEKVKSMKWVVSDACLLTRIKIANRKPIKKRETYIHTRSSRRKKKRRKNMRQKNLLWLVSFIYLVLGYFLLVIINNEEFTTRAVLEPKKIKRWSWVDLLRDTFVLSFTHKQIFL